MEEIFHVWFMNPNLRMSEHMILVGKSGVAMIEVVIMGSIDSSVRELGVNMMGRECTGSRVAIQANLKPPREKGREYG